MHEKNKVLILGGMMELGAGSVDEHKAIIELIGRYHWNTVVLVGGDFRTTNNSYIYFETADACLEWVTKQNFHNSYFLIKGSRSIQLEKVVNGFKN
jgi:UDP-N-acetylmuramoyl-tripeptide--D-alanyl-D-alanine ligase